MTVYSLFFIAAVCFSWRYQWRLKATYQRFLSRLFHWCCICTGHSQTPLTVVILFHGFWLCYRYLIIFTNAQFHSHCAVVLSKCNVMHMITIGCCLICGGNFIERNFVIDRTSRAHGKGRKWKSKHINIMKRYPLHILLHWPYYLHPLVFPEEASACYSSLNSLTTCCNCIYNHQSNLVRMTI